MLPDFVTLGLPLVVLVSILWTAWDPTYAGFRRARFQGRAVRVHGRKLHIVSASAFRPQSLRIHSWSEYASIGVVTTNVYGCHPCNSETEARLRSHTFMGLSSLTYCASVLLYYALL